MTEFVKGVSGSFVKEAYILSKDSWTVIVQPIADKVAQHLEMISKHSQFSTLLIGTNRKSHGQNCGSLTTFEKSSRDSVPPYLQSAVVIAA